jgi:hypothetical protein
MKDKDHRRELIKEEKNTSLDQAIDLIISLERHEADFDAPRTSSPTGANQAGL